MVQHIYGELHTPALITLIEKETIMQPSPSQHEVPTINKLRGLIGVQKPVVLFDPSNPQHREAYRMLAQDGRQHPTLRFVLEYPFQDILSYMERRISLYAVQELKAAA